MSHIVPFVGNDAMVRAHGYTGVTLRQTRRVTLRNSFATEF